MLSYSDEKLRSRNPSYANNRNQQQPTASLPPPPPRPSTTDPALATRVSALEKIYNHDLYSKIDHYVNKTIKEAVHNALQVQIRERFKDLTEFKMKEILRDQMFESGSYKSHPEHTTLYKALEASMDYENWEEFTEKWLSHADALAQIYKDPEEYKLLWKTRDIGPSLSGIADRLGSRSSSKLIWKVQLRRGPPGQVTIQTQYFFNKDLEYLVSDNKDRRNALLISKLKAAYYPDFGLEELVSSLWIESERDYDISVAYGISHWWFKRKEFYITRHSDPFNRSAVRSHIKILSVVSLKTFSIYGYTYLKEIVLRRANYKEYMISEADFKNLHLNDFEDMYLLHLQGKLNHLSGADKVHLFNAFNLWIRNIVIRQRVEDLELDIESYQTQLNLTQDRNNQKTMTSETEVHKFCNGTLTRILEKLDVMVKDYVLFKFNPDIEHRIWSEDDKWKSQEFIKLIERRLKIKRIFRSFESFVSGRLRDVDYRLINKTE
ncbi:hypothetical protein Tco_0795328 [Tanacetum coccineum]